MEQYINGLPKATEKHIKKYHCSHVKLSHLHFWQTSIKYSYTLLVCNTVSLYKKSEKKKRFVLSKNNIYIYEVLL